MKQKVLLLLFYIMLSYGAFAQKEASNWFFGTNAGLTWNTTRSFSATGLTGTPNATLDNLPVGVTGSPINTLEGCFSLSDGNGDLLFYSDGSIIWDRTHAVMQNGSGLLGFTSSAQSGVVLPYPGQTDKYIALSMDQWSYDIFAYSIIDMNSSTNGGYINGAVVEKNTRFSGHSGMLGESVTVIKHANGTDWWIVAPGKGSPLYLNAWLVTSNGIQHTSPVVTSATGINVATGRAHGYFKFTANGAHFVWGTWRDEKLIFGDFNNSTGQFSNIKKIDSGFGSQAGPYGIEFSQSGKYLYVGINSGGAFDGHIRVYKYDELKSASDPSTVTYKQSPSSLFLGGALQLDPNGRMFSGTSHSVGSNARHICVIDDPEDYDNLKYYILNNFLPAGTSNNLGLPSFSASWWNLDIDDIETDTGLPVCRDTEITFSAALSSSDISQIAHIKWNFGDGTLINDTNIGATISQKHTYKKPGTYTLTLTPYKTDGTIVTGSIKTLEVEILPCVMPVNPNIHMSN